VETSSCASRDANVRNDACCSNSRDLSGFEELFRSSGRAQIGQKQMKCQRARCLTSRTEASDTDELTGVSKYGCQ
jgi:hypothetical protein